MLFDSARRTDSSPATYAEDTFSFLNRVAGAPWDNVRALLNEWFRCYPSAHAGDLKARFVSNIPSQHAGAWWELYLHTLFTGLGFAVQVHPELPGRPTHPDFWIENDDTGFFLEAVTASSGVVDETRDDTREGWILDAVNMAKSPDFFVGLDFERVGTLRPKVRTITRPIEQWLRSLDADDVTVSMNDGGDPPEFALQIDDWEMSFEAYPIKPENRGDPEHRLLGRGPISGGWVNDIEVLQKALRRKFHKYGKPDAPFAVAVLAMSSFVETRDFEQALFGRHAVQYEIGRIDSARWVRQRNGVWMGPSGPRGTAASAVLTAANIQPWTVCRSVPRVWVNPWAGRPFDCDLPLGGATASSDGLIELKDPVRGAPELFQLTPDWPGFRLAA